MNVSPRREFSPQSSINPATAGPGVAPAYGLATLWPMRVCTRVGCWLSSLVMAGLSGAQTVPIHAVQGAGSRSPFEGQVVTTRGVVTGVKGNGFFIQTPVGDEDGDPATSEGVLVFTGGRPPSTVQAGNLVSVRGRVVEYAPASDPHCPPLTEIAESPVVTLLGSGFPLPEPIGLTAGDLDAAGGVEQLERFEGMRVRVESLTVVGPTGGSVNETTGGVTSNGLFYGVLTGTPRPFREAGLEAPEPLPGVPCCVPRFDGNPERLAVDSDALAGSNSLEVPVGAVVSGLVGPLDYTCRTYLLALEVGASVSVAIPPAREPLPPAGPHELAIASWNLHRFFDAVDDPGINEPVLTPEAWARRLKRAARAVVAELRLPDVIGVQEVENLGALQALAMAASAEAIVAGGRDPGYQAYLQEGNDAGGIDVGFLVKTSRVDVVEVRQEAKGERLAMDGTLLHDRPPLLLRATVAAPGGGRFPFTVIVNHLRSLTDIAHPDKGARVRAKRQEQAESLARIVHGVRQRTPGEAIVVLGDLNAFEFNDGYVDVVGTVAGRPAAADQVVVNVSRVLLAPPLHILTAQLPAAARYSYVYRGNAQVLDHILVSDELADRVHHLAAVRFNADFPESWRADDGQLRRLSDHDPVVVHLRIPGSAPRARPVVRRSR